MEVEYAAYAGVPGRNVLRANGGFEIWQRDSGGTASFSLAASAVAYTADRWYLYPGSGQTGDVDQVVGNVNGSRYACRVRRPAGQTGVNPGYFGYPLDTDEIYPLLGQYLRLSFNAKCGAGYSPASGFLAAGMYHGTGAPTKLVGGAGYVGQTTLFAQNFPLTTTAALFQLGSATVLPITARQAEVVFWWVPVGTASAAGDDSFFIDDVQLEVVGSPQQQASPFERLMFQEELQLCQRHFFKTFHYGTAPAYAVGQNTGELRSTPGFAGADTRAGNGHTIRFPVPMRVVPTVVDFNVEVAANAQVRNLSLSLNHTASNPIVSDTVYRVLSTGVATGAEQHHIGIHFTADAGI